MNEVEAGCIHDPEKKKQLPVFGKPVDLFLFFITDSFRHILNYEFLRHGLVEPDNIHVGGEFQQLSERLSRQRSNVNSR